MVTLDDPVAVGGVELRNRLYRTPLLECAGNGPDAVSRLVDELAPAAESGVGCIHQGATLVRDEGGCAAPNMTRVHDPEFVDDLGALPDAIHDHGGRVFVQLAEGGLRSMETWHAEYRDRHPDAEQQVVSRPPWQLRLLDRVGFVDLTPHVLSTGEVEGLAQDFGRAAERTVEAGYDGVHLAGANMGIIQQFLSPFYNHRDDEFADGVTFLERVHDEIRDRVGDVPLITKVPAETAAPPTVRRHLSLADGVDIAARLAKAGFDGVVPVECSVVWDMSLVRGEFPDRAWTAEDLQADYDAAFGSRLRVRVVRLLNWLQARRFEREPGWNETFCRRVRERLHAEGHDDVVVCCEGGVRTRTQCDRLLGDGPDRPAADLVGMGRPFYAEPRLGARLLAGEDAICRSCNNCTVPQATGAEGRCRTPSVVRERGRLAKDGAYEGNSFGAPE
ncbi:oxidoreductase [Halorientalis salina]|uniref:oxidoreductase n=1 Tax=Halorientalis salina TaxID=2932266 RepID=UPI0010AD6CF3|nr:NADH:flavin oxidoreductase [Halorientalis salina]